MDITAYFQHTFLRINRLAIIPFFKNMAGDSVLRIKIIGIALVDKGHNFGYRLLFGAYLQVKMVGHQTVRSKFKWGFLIDLSKDMKKRFKISIISEKRLTTITAADNVIE